MLDITKPCCCLDQRGADGVAADVFLTGVAGDDVSVPRFLEIAR
jgi:hypothetical protein